MYHEAIKRMYDGDIQSFYGENFEFHRHTFLTFTNVIASVIVKW